MSTPAPGTGTPTPSATISGAELVGDLPQVSPHIVAANTAANTAPAAAPSPLAGEKDSLGRIYDPAKFRPEKDILGRWKNLKGGAPKGPRVPKPDAPSAAGSTVPADLPREPAPGLPSAAPSPTAPASAPQPIPDELKAEASSNLAIALMLSATVVGNDMAPDNDAELLALRDSYAEYLRATGAKPSSPAARFYKMVFAYVAKRANRPNIARLIVSYAPFLAPYLGIQSEKKPAPASAPAPEKKPETAPAPSAAPAPAPTPIPEKTKAPAADPFGSAFSRP